MSDPQMPNCRFLPRPASPDDIDEIVRINDESGLSRWAPEEYRILLGRPGIKCVVAERSGWVAGFCLSWFLGPEADLLKIAVSVTERRGGIGRLLMNRLMSDAAEAGVEVCFLEVRQGNLVALEFYHGFGFRECGKRRAYYNDPVEDALVLRCDLRPMQETGCDEAG